MLEESESDIDKLNYAVREGNYSLVKELINNGCGVNSFDELALAPLHCAAEKGDIEMMKLLIELGADVNSHCEEKIGETPLGHVAQNCTFETAKFLVDHGADPGIRGWMWLTALDRASERKKPEGRKVYQLLLHASKKTKHSPHKK